MREKTVEAGRVRRMWHLLEPLHALLYYAPEAFDEAAALGYGTAERWPSYFAWRAAPLGTAGPVRVASAFYSFSPDMVARYVPGARPTAADPAAPAIAGPADALAPPPAIDPADVLAARLRAVDRAYRAVLGEEAVAGPAWRRPPRSPAGRRRRPGPPAVRSPPPTPNSLGPGPRTSSSGRPRRSCASTGATGTSPPSWPPGSIRSRRSSPSRRSAPRPHPSSRAGLVRRRVVRRPGTARRPGARGRGRHGHRGRRALRAGVERRTDELAADPWAALGPEGADHLADLLGGPWLAAIGSGLLPAENTLGIGKV